MGTDRILSRVTFDKKVSCVARRSEKDMRRIGSAFSPSALICGCFRAPRCRGNFFRARLYNLSVGVQYSRAGRGAMKSTTWSMQLGGCWRQTRRVVPPPRGSRYQRPLLTLIRNLTPPDTDHEGVAQEVFLAAFRSLASFDPKRSAFSTWLFTIARNRCRNELARRRPVVGAELPDVVDLRSPERAASEAELFRQLDAALGALPFEQRSAFVLAHLQGLSYEEVARIEGVGVGTVKSRIARAREKLRCLLRHAAEPHS